MAVPWPYPDIFPAQPCRSQEAWCKCTAQTRGIQRAGLCISKLGNFNIVEPPLTNVDNFVGSEGTTLDIAYQDLIGAADEADDGVRSFTAWRPDGSLWQHATPFLRRLRAVGTYKRPTKPLSYRSRSHKAPALAGGGRDLRAYRIYRRESMTTILINGTETLDEKEFSHG